MPKSKPRPRAPAEAALPCVVRSGQQSALRDTCVQKTSVYLTPEEVARLAALAERDGTSRADIIRRAIRLYEPERKGDRNFTLAGIADGPGASIADVAEGELLEGFGD